MDVNPTVEQRLTAIEGRLDRVEQGVADLLTNRAEMIDTLRAVRTALDVKIDEAERMTRVEDGLDRLTRSILGAVEAEIESGR